MDRKFSLGTNISVVNGASIPESSLPNKHSGMCYHAIIEASAANIRKVWFVKETHNIDNCLTNIISVTDK